MCSVTSAKLRGILFLLFLFVGSCCYTLISQEKLEKEYRLQTKEVPISALSFVESLNFENNIKWYKEEGLTSESIEAKTKHQGKRHSVEFDTSGKLQDIEIETDWDMLPKSVRNNIKTHLTSLYITYTICKIQEQYSGEKQHLLILMGNGDKNVPHTLKYEIVLKGKNQKGKHLYEFLFSENGTFETKSKIIFRSTDNMEF